MSEYDYIIYRTRSESNLTKALDALDAAGIKNSIHYTYTERCQVRIPWTNMEDVEKAKNVLRKAGVMRERKN